MPAQGNGRAWLVCLFALVVLAGALRLYRLDAQSIWLDEWPNVAHLTAPDAMTYVRLIQIMYPEQAQGPLYYFLQYGWAHLFGVSLFVLRLLPVLLGLAAVPLVFALVNHVYGRRAGLIAALCLALSPQHIWYAQEIRPYALLTLLVIVSLYAFMRMTQESGPRWLCLNLAVNGLLVWTHVFAVIVLLIEGCMLLAQCRQFGLRRVAIWIGVQVLVLAPWAAWVLTMPYSNEHASYFHSIRGIFDQIMASDIVSFHPELLPPWKTTEAERLSSLSQWILPARPALDYLMLLVFCLAGLRLLRDGLRRADACGCPGAPQSSARRNAMLLCLILVLPGLLLGILTFATCRPFLSPMYTMYSTIGLYAGVGAFFAGVSRKAVRRWALVALGILYAYQLALLLPEVTRTDWRGGASYISANAAPNDLALDLENFWPVDCLGYYLEGSGVPVRRVTTFQAACDESAAHLLQPESGAPRAVWLAFEVEFFKWLAPAYDMKTSVTQGLAARGLAATWHEFPGHRNLLVLKIACAPGVPVQASTEAVRGPWPVDCARILADIGVAYPDQHLSESAVQALRHVIPVWPAMNKFYAMMYCVDLVAYGRADLAEAMSRHVIAAHPGFGLGHFALGLARLAQGDRPGAGDSFNEAFQLHAGLAGLLEPFAAATCDLQNPESVQSEIGRLAGIHFVFTDALRRVAEQ